MSKRKRIAGLLTIFLLLIQLSVCLAQGAPLGRAQTGAIVYTTGAKGEFYLPSGIWVDKAGALYVADTMNDCVHLDAGSQTLGSPGLGGSSYAASGGYFDKLEAALFCKPSDVLASSRGLIICDTGNHSVRKVVGDRLVTIAGNGNPGFANGLHEEVMLNAPAAVAEGPDGVIYIADTLNHCIRAVDAGNNVTLFAGTPGVAGYTDGSLGDAQFFEPAGLAFGPNGALYVADSANHAIRKIHRGVVTTLAGGQAGEPDEFGYTAGGLRDGQQAMFRFPKGVAVDDNGAVYVADTFNHCVRVIQDGETLTLLGDGVPGFAYDTFGGFRLARPMGVAVRGGQLYVSDSLNNTVVRLDLATAREHSKSLDVPEQSGLAYTAADITGTPKMRRAGGAALFTAYRGMVIREGDTVITDNASSLRLTRDRESLFIGENSTVAFNHLLPEGSETRLFLIEGVVKTDMEHTLSPWEKHEIETPTAIAGIRGTVYLVFYSRMLAGEAATKVMVLQNTISLTTRLNGITRLIQAAAEDYLGNKEGFLRLEELGELTLRELLNDPALIGLSLKLYAAAKALYESLPASEPGPGPGDEETLIVYERGTSKQDMAQRITGSTKEPSAFVFIETPVEQPSTFVFAPPPSDFVFEDIPEETPPWELPTELPTMVPPPPMPTPTPFTSYAVTWPTVLGAYHYGDNAAFVTFSPTTAVGIGNDGRSVPGSFSWVAPDTMLRAGANNYTVTFTPTDLTIAPISNTIVVSAAPLPVVLTYSLTSYTFTGTMPEIMDYYLYTDILIQPHHATDFLSISDIVRIDIGGITATETVQLEAPAGSTYRFRYTVNYHGLSPGSDFAEYESILLPLKFSSSTATIRFSIAP